VESDEELEDGQLADLETDDNGDAMEII